MSVSVIFAVSAALGFAREAVLAGFFGVSAEYDAFVVAMIIPHFFIAMLGEASMGAAVTPVFLNVIAPQSTKEQRRILGSGFALMALVFAAAAAAGIVFAPQIARVFAPGFTQSQLDLTATLMRVLMPGLLMLGLSNFIVGILHALRRFSVAASMGVVFNLSVVLVTIPLADRLGIVAAAVGVLVGTALQLGIMIPSLISEKLFPALGASFRDPALVKMWRLFWPILAGALVVTALQTGDKVIGSFLAEGSLSALSFGKQIAGGPARIFTMSLAVVLFPELVRRVRDDTGKRGDLVVRGMTIGAFLTLPWMGIFIALREPITSVLLERGAFDAKATAFVALPLAIYSLGEYASGIGTMVNNAYYSHDDSKLPTLIYIGTFVVRIAIILLLVPWLGYLGIAAGHVIAINAGLAASVLILRRRYMPDIDLGRLTMGLLRILVASALAAFLAGAVYAFLGPSLPGTFLGMLFGIAVASALSIAGYFAAARVLGSEEAVEAQRRAVAVLRRK